MKHRLALSLRIALPASLAGVLAAASPPSKPLTPSEIVARAPPSAWAAVPDDDLLVIDLDNRQRVAIALAPDFAPVHVANIRRLARAGWFTGITINRVQDNYVTQWGDATEKKPLPADVVAHPPAEYERPLKGLGFRALGYRDAYAAQAGHAGGWPVATDGKLAWLTHCYAMVGVGRNLAPDTGTGAELYAVIGHAPRHLDRNITTVGRVLAGMEALAALPRGTEALGVYKEGVARPAIVSARLAADMPAAGRPRFEIMRSDSIDFANWVSARANRKDDFFIRPAGAVDICNAMPPVRPAAK
ncbi:peptidylprolyl isomerase [Rhizorhabdus dicambivorans]|uniref:Peptidylprolyl isomerase n=1 Tax=Rhizorhabdus dicambivorans TaxID=1850238 RepID=A0A2A4FZ68_9SPHN|nr:peptidylprolyl isomerase [Rhizorhabdus dicambivorans]ATE63595.1 peptidylprolyl isomerase [Rhizorhabdus dicambivorans]PCE42722.1 peptidylprolyl isomerase [Rhizorhabdus dicambivorans]